MKLVKTTVEVWQAIRDAHPELIVFGSFSDPTGSFPDGFHGNAKMMTQYGFEGQEIPVIMAETTWQIPSEGWGGGHSLLERENEYDRYWLCFPPQENSADIGDTK